jgi:hypothetical protein
MNKKKLTALFEKLGARRPEAWAESQLDANNPQLARFWFLRQAWRSVVDESDSSWIANPSASAESKPQAPYAGVGHALRQLRGRGATDTELTDLVRGMQAELLFQLCYLLDGPGDVEPEVADVAWCLVQVDDDGNVLANRAAIHADLVRWARGAVRWADSAVANIKTSTWQRPELCPICHQGSALTFRTCPECTSAILIYEKEGTLLVAT